MDGVIGVVTCFAGSFAPKNYALCFGQTVSIVTNQALFAIIGTSFGGDGVQTFKLPDLRGRAPVSPPAGSVTPGAMAGAEYLTISGNQLPAHTHTGDVSVYLQCNDDDGIDPTSSNGYPSGFTAAYSNTSNCSMAALQTYFAVNSGAGTPVNTCSPYLVVNYIICVAGIFPSRN